jgi:hypothetical protein
MIFEEVEEVDLPQRLYPWLCLYFLIRKEGC